MAAQPEQFLYGKHSEVLQNVVVSGISLASLVEDIQKLYLLDDRPWIIGFSGGKDSTAVLSLVFSAIQGLVEKAKKPHKRVYVVSSDTLVETPVIVNHMQSILQKIEEVALSDNMPFSSHTVYPRKEESFWVNLLGKGYPAPSVKFRWCTERMKINPVSEFITSRVLEHGEVVVVLGSRRKESSTRAQAIAKHSIKGSVFGRHSSLPNAYTYMPIEDWSADEVWEYLMSGPCPWGGSNRALFELYKGSNQGECPLVIDKSTPSCGNSRFGCWTCTVVTKDRALHGLIESGETWMKPLLDFRNMLYDATRGEHASENRNYKRRTGRFTFDAKDKDAQEKKLIPGPYWMACRKKWLRKLLEIEKSINEQGHEIELISRQELQIIQQEWLKDPNEPDWEDSAVRIFREVYPDEEIEWADCGLGVFTGMDAGILKELEETHGVPAEMIMKLLELENAQYGLGKRIHDTKQLIGILKRDWESLDTVKSRHHRNIASNPYSEKLEELKKKYQDIDRNGA